MNATKSRFLKSSNVAKKPFFDKWLLIPLVMLGCFGLLAVFNSSVVMAFREFGDEYHFIKNQFVFMVAGFTGLLIISKIPYQRWYKLSIPLLFATLVMLLAVFIPGVGVHTLGAKRWINLGFFSIQPTEIAKLALVIYLSAWFSRREKGRFLPFLTLLAVVVGLVILQPDLGTALIITAIAFVLYFLSGAPLIHFVFIVPFVLVGAVGLAVVAPYRLARVITFLNPANDPLGMSYHIRQILIALGSGGLFGLGFGKSRQKYEYLPEANTDSIFAIIAEEIGFAGVLILLMVILFIIVRAFAISSHAPDRFGQLLANGIGIWFAIQVIINVSSMVALVPLTGVPLPLVSYGGSNLVSLLLGFGILLNISSQSRKKL